MIVASVLLYRTAVSLPLRTLLATRRSLAPSYTTYRSMSVFNATRLLGKTVLITGASAGIGAVSALLNLNMTQPKYGCLSRQQRSFSLKYVCTFLRDTASMIDEQTVRLAQT